MLLLLLIVMLMAIHIVLLRMMIVEIVIGLRQRIVSLHLTGIRIVLLIVIEILLEGRHRRYVNDTIGHHFEWILSGLAAPKLCLLLLLLLGNCCCCCCYSGRICIVFGERDQTGMQKAGGRAGGLANVTLLDPKWIVGV